MTDVYPTRTTSAERSANDEAAVAAELVRRATAVREAATNMKGHQ